MIGRVFLGRYEATRLLGEGGMGRVYLARQVDLGRQVVIKVMHDQIAADPKFRERFQRETLLMARFQHPYAVTLYDASLHDPLGPCIIMEYIKGVNLDALLTKNGRFTPARVGRLLGQLEAGAGQVRAAVEERRAQVQAPPAGGREPGREAPRTRRALQPASDGDGHQAAGRQLPGPMRLLRRGVQAAGAGGPVRGAEALGGIQ